MRHATLAIPAYRIARAVGERPIVLDQPLERFPGEVEAVERRVAPLKRGHRAQCLGVVVEAAEIAEAAVKRTLTGMAEWRMAEIVRQRQRLCEVLVEAERPSQGTGDLGDFQSVGEARTEVVAFMKDEDLRLVGQPAKSRRMDDAVAVPPEFAARRARRFSAASAAAPPGVGRIRGSCTGRFDHHSLLPCRLTKALVALNYWSGHLAIG